MKGILSFSLAISLIIILSSCGSSNTPTDASPSISASSPPPQETSADSSPSPSASATPPQETSSDTTPSPSASATPPQETPDNGSEPSSSPTPDVPEQKPASRGIQGSHGTDIRMGLKKFGIEEPSIKSAPKEAKDFFAFTSTANYKDPLLGVIYDYSLTMDSDFQIIGASFGITNENAKYDDFITIAKLYLGFSSTMPYDAFDAAQARSWTEENIGTVKPGENASTTIGDATFELYGSKSGDGFGSFWLDISKANEE